jgi:4-oxalocrotonate tautomerase
LRRQPFKTLVAHASLQQGRTEPQKERLAEAVTQAVTSSLGVGAESVSVSLEEFASSEWTEKVYRPDIVNGHGKLYKRPGYTPR